MEDPKDKELDHLFHKLIKEHGLQQPSAQFTDNLMNVWLHNDTVIQYQPLIGRRGKILILAVIIIFIILSFLPAASTTPFYLEFISYLNLLSSLQFSSEFGIIFFTCSVGVWILMAFDRVLKTLILR